MMLSKKGQAVRQFIVPIIILLILFFVVSLLYVAFSGKAEGLLAVFGRLFS